MLDVLQSLLSNLCLLSSAKYIMRRLN
jgi:hypothetical protein